MTLLLALILVGAPRAAERDAAAISAELRQELTALDSLVDDGESAAVQAELHRKIRRVEGLLAELERSKVGAGPAVAEAILTAPMATSPLSPLAPLSSTSTPAARTEALGATALVGGLPPNPLNPTRPEMATAPTPPPLVPCVPARLDQIAASLRDARFNTEKQDRLREAVQGTSFTAAQARYLMGQFDFGSDQIEAGVTLYRHISDPEQWYQVYEVFTFKNDAKRLRDKVGR